MPQRRRMGAQWLPAFFTTTAIGLFFCLLAAIASGQRTTASYAYSNQPAASVETVGESYYTARAMKRANLPATTTSTPSIVSVDVSPRNAHPRDTLVLTYTVSSPSSQQVSLGAGMRVSSCLDYFYEPSLDVTVTVASGISTVTRSFILLNNTGMTYDVRWGLWAPGFGLQYDERKQNGLVRWPGQPPRPPYQAL